MSCYYEQIEFKTTLLAQWAAFFDLAGWTWQTNPAPVGDWVPDFYVEFPCGHSECPDGHSLLVNVLPILDVADVPKHPALEHRYSVPGPNGTSRANAGAVLGSNPAVSSWEMAHGAGGGIDDVPVWVNDWRKLWHQAGEIVK
ncbi:hypothetical protein [Paraburkholderia sp. BL17N1]|uniref:hypothetical protein n=1 Tax=Paraburkholderia sp. BL17N1 TaxID=1938798 RepID=UPI000EADA14E|nr:hypothetical protein [Paraburkholderia sp. BL17N1]RKR31699.1 hypothetical protein B0G82_7937 [Paraburkholderia sp. BL17N1]